MHTTFHLIIHSRQVDHIPRLPYLRSTGQHKFVCFVVFACSRRYNSDVCTRTKRIKMTVDWCMWIANERATIMLTSKIDFSLDFPSSLLSFYFSALDFINAPSEPDIILWLAISCKIQRNQSEPVIYLYNYETLNRSLGLLQHTHTHIHVVHTRTHVYVKWNSLSFTDLTRSIIAYNSFLDLHSDIINSINKNTSAHTRRSMAITSGVSLNNHNNNNKSTKRRLESQL